MIPIFRIINKNVVIFVSFPASLEPPFDPATASCNFEAGLCHYMLDNVAGSSWRRVSVKHNIFRHGDHTTGAGGIMLVEDEHDVINLYKGPDLFEHWVNLNRASFLSHCGQI